MSSRDGASRADISVGLLHDEKVVRLARLQKDHVKTLASLMLYTGAVLASWGENRPALLVDAAPAWMLDDAAPWVADLIAVGLLDADGRIPAKALDEWMGPYRKAIAGGVAGAARRWGGHKEATGRAMPGKPVSLPGRGRPREPGPVAPLGRLDEVAKEAGGFVGRLAAKRKREDK